MFHKRVREVLTALGFESTLFDSCLFFQFVKPGGSDKVTINEKAKIVDSISLGKGMIYIIDAVLMPPVGVSK